MIKCTLIHCLSQPPSEHVLYMTQFNEKQKLIIFPILLVLKENLN